MDCASVRRELHDLLRGRAGATEAELRAHLAGCAACRHEEEAERLLDEALATRLPPVQAPPALRRRIAAEVEAAEAGTRDSAPRRRRAPAAWLAAAAAAGIALASGGFLAGRAVQGRAAGGERLADEVVADHLRTLASAHPHDVESTDTHQVKPWFEGRLDFAPVVPADRGELRLQGGAVGYVLGHRAAVLSYGLRRHRVTLLAFPRRGVPGLERAAQDAPPLELGRHGFAVSLWSAGDVGYALVSDVGAEEHARLAGVLAAETRLPEARRAP